MHVLRKMLAATAAALTVLASGALVAHADSTPSVYNTPGGQFSAGRMWNTTCEMYSSNVVRCRAAIWATQAQYRDGHYVAVTGWTFNNLSYLPAPRATWAGNNLGQNTEKFTSGGRTWQTQCDTPWTGRGGCRSFVWTKQPFHAAGGGWVSDYTWAFNNLVLFSSPTVPAVTKVPPWIIDQSVLTYVGLGPLELGVAMKDLATLGYVAKRTTDGCTSWEPSQSLKNRGIQLLANGSKLGVVLVTKPGAMSIDGAQVGMTLGQLKNYLGPQLTLVTKDGYEPVYTAVVKHGPNELVFLDSFELNRPLVDSDVMNMMLVRKADAFLGWDGC